MKDWQLFKKIDKNEVVFIDKTGKVILDDGYYKATGFKNGLAEFQYSGSSGWNIIDKTGKAILKNSHTGISSIEGRGPIAVIKAYDKGWGDLERKYVYYDYAVNTGKFYKSGGYFEENRICVCDFNNNCGFLDETGKEIIPLIYQGVFDFSNGLAGVKKDGKWGYIDANGKTVIDFKYDHAESFKNGKAIVQSNDDKTPQWFYIDKTGKALITRTSLADFRKKLEQGDDVSFLDNGVKQAMIIEIKGNLVQVQTKERYPDNKWVKKSEVYPTNHFD